MTLTPLGDVDPVETSDVHALIGGCSVTGSLDLGDAVTLRTAPFSVRLQRAVHFTAVQPHDREALLPDNSTRDVYWDRGSATTDVELLVRNTTKRATFSAKERVVDWIVCLLRLRGFHEAKGLIKASFSVSNIFDEPPPPTQMLVTLDQSPSVRVSNTRPKREIDQPEGVWLRENWSRSLSQIGENERVEVAASAILRCPWSDSLEYAIVILWSGLEALFGIDSELSYRLAGYAATYLSPAGEERYDKYREVKALYRRRSRAVHGGGRCDLADVQSSYKLLSAVLVKCVENASLPDPEALARSLHTGEHC